MEEKDKDSSNNDNIHLDNEKEENESTEKRSRIKAKRPEYKKKRVFVPTIISVLLVIFGIVAAIHSTYYQSTDDAFVEGRLVSIAPRVSGPIVKLFVNDNQIVKKGQLLLEIDPNDYEVKLEQTEAKLAEAKAQLQSSEQQVEQGNSTLNQSYQDITATKSQLDFAQNDYKRYHDMFKSGITSKQDYDSSTTHLTVANSSHKSAKDKSKALKSALESSKDNVKVQQADIKRLEAEVDQAKLDLSYTKIYAPQSGMVASRSIEQGNYVQVGQPLMAVVQSQIWVVANFKEIQLTHMKKGQPVSIKIDTYPGKRFKGEVDSIQRETGAKSSLFPPENAVGSYVKIVQRIPVKIVFKEDISKYNIVPGMSVTPKVKVK